MADFGDLVQALKGQPQAQGGGADFYQNLVGPGDYSPPSSGPLQYNLMAADAALNMTPQERALYQMHLRNLTGAGGVDNPDGSRSTVYTAVQEHNGKFYNIPTVWNGKREVEPYTRPDGSSLDVPNATTLANVSKLGWDAFPSYATPEEADARYDKMHKYMEKDTAQYFGSRGK